MTGLTDFQQKMASNLPGVDLRFEEPMADHTSFRIGGAVEVMAFPKSVEEMSSILKTSALLDCKPAILGAGTNVLAPDEGVRGLVICLKDCLGGMEQIGATTIRVAGGVTMTRAAVFAANLGLSGLEFAHGIPGTVGGGVYMNAGAYGGEICQVCKSVDVMDFEGNIHTFTNAEMGFSYRNSILEECGGIVVCADFELSEKPTEEIREKMKELMGKRSASQPLDKPSAGSAFKRPTGGYAAALIDQAGLKGYAVGGAAISTKHAGFAVNLGGATAADVKALLAQVSDIVFEKSGIRLEPEVRIW
ncbi:MAG: UDP-N-acetylmuramate dehydrogenase [Oscillospiraceae bacterium]|nr:UDP-N-acetylmuramate dehydrogenase [Oscillospiraceae bacterium]